MSTDAQMIANRANAQKSTGPRTEAGKARSRWNATDHGLTAEHLPDDLTLTDVYKERHKELTAEFQPETPYLKQVLNLAVLAYIQSTTAFDMLAHEFAKQRHVAKNGWESMREAEAMEFAAKIGNNPTVIAAQLRQKKAGCLVLIEYWTRLKNMLGRLEQWKEDHIAMAFDLMGVPKPLRDDTSQLTASQGDTVGNVQKALAESEIAKLQRHLLASATDLDEFSRTSHLNGPVCPLNPEIKLLMRYQTETSRRYMKLMKPLVDTLGRSTSKRAPRGRQNMPIAPPSPIAQSPEPPQATQELRDLQAEIRLKGQKPLFLVEHSLREAVHKVNESMGKPNYAEVCQNVRNAYAVAVDDYLERTGKRIFDLDPLIVHVFTSFDPTIEGA